MKAWLLLCAAFAAPWLFALGVNAFIEWRKRR